MKKTITLALAASIFMLALAANPHTASASTLFFKWHFPGQAPPTPPPPTRAAVVMRILGALYSVVFF
jgi:hypothetical protein